MLIKAICMDCAKKRRGFLAELFYRETDVIEECSYCKEMKRSVEDNGKEGELKKGSYYIIF